MSEISWLHRLDEKYKIQAGSHSMHSVYPVEILPPNLQRWVKNKSLGPSYGTRDGMTYVIWGWSAIPSESTSEHADWHDSITVHNDE